MELDDFKEEWRLAEQKAKEFSMARLSIESVRDRLINTHLIQFGKIAVVSLAILFIGTVFLSPAEDGGFLPALIMVSACLLLTMPLYISFRASIKKLKSLDVSANVLDSLHHYKLGIETQMKVQKLSMLAVIITLIAFSFLVPSLIPMGFEVAATVGIYTIILLVYSYRHFTGPIKSELKRIDNQLKNAV